MEEKHESRILREAFLNAVSKSLTLSTTVAPAAGEFSPGPDLLPEMARMESRRDSGAYTRCTWGPYPLFKPE